MTTDSIIMGRRGEPMGAVVNVHSQKTDTTDFFWKNNPRRDSPNKKTKSVRCTLLTFKHHNKENDATNTNNCEEKLVSTLRSFKFV
jgi:hypothetical protein